MKPFIGGRERTGSDGFEAFGLGDGESEDVAVGAGGGNAVVGEIVVGGRTGVEIAADGAPRDECGTGSRTGGNDGRVHPEISTSIRTSNIEILRILRIPSLRNTIAKRLEG
jgi:hypothetical protein